MTPNVLVPKIIQKSTVKMKAQSVLNPQNTPKTTISLSLQEIGKICKNIFFECYMKFFGRLEETEIMFQSRNISDKAILKAHRKFRNDL